MILKIYDEVSSERSKIEADKIRKNVFGIALSLSDGLSEENESPKIIVE